ncbi:MAG: hypothetical protein AB7K63_08885 [Vicinamibacterales bacterium]
MAIAVLLWSASPDRTIGRLEHEVVSDFSTIRIRSNGDVRVMTFVRDNGEEVVQTRANLAEPHTLVAPYARAMFTSYLYQPEPRRVLIVGLGGGAMVRFLIHHEPDVEIDAVEIDPAVVRLGRVSTSASGPAATSASIPPTRWRSSSPPRTGTT